LQHENNKSWGGGAGAGLVVLLGTQGLAISHPAAAE